MARKTLDAISPGLQDEIDNFYALASVQSEIARDVFNAQDDATKKVLLQVSAKINDALTGYVELDGHAVKVDQDWRGLTLYLAVSICSDLGLVDLQVANFKFAEAICAACGSEV